MWLGEHLYAAWAEERNINTGLSIRDGGTIIKRGDRVNIMGKFLVSMTSKLPLTFMGLQFRLKSSALQWDGES